MLTDTRTNLGALPGLPMFYQGETVFFRPADGIILLLVCLVCTKVHPDHHLSVPMRCDLLIFCVLFSVYSVYIYIYYKHESSFMG